MRMGHQEIGHVGRLETVMRKALDQARRGRMHILDKMKEALGESRQSISLFAPRIVTCRVHGASSC